MTEFTGGCLCGAVRYRAEAEPLFMANCHCLDCRKSSAAGHKSLFGLPESSLEFTGELKEYDVTADSGGTVSHKFCPTCGSQVFSATTNGGGSVAVVAATLDDPALFSPQASVYASRATPWDPPKDGIPQFEKMPPRG